MIEGTPFPFQRVGRRGPTVLFLPGWGASHALWESVMVAMADQCQCLALDLPDDAFDAVTPSGMHAIAARIGLFLDRLDVSEATVVGHALGGMVALHLALARPALVSRLVLVAADYVGHLPPALHIALSTLGRPFLKGLHLARLALTPDTAATSHLIPAPLAASFRHSARLAQLPGLALQRTLGALAQRALIAEVSQVRQPTLLICGDHDPIIPAARAEWLAMRLPNAHLATINGAGHHPMADDPTTFLRLLSPFVLEAVPTLPRPR